MAVSKITRVRDITSTTVQMTVNINANETKYFGATKPSDTNHTWILVSIDTQTWSIALNDFSNNGFRLKNNDSTAKTNYPVVLTWLGY